MFGYYGKAFFRKNCEVRFQGYKKDKIMMPGMEKDMLNGYALGADDYVTKPFSLPVLYAKAMALTSRARGEH